jgi:hypothetical protein
MLRAVYNTTGLTDVRGHKGAGVPVAFEEDRKAVEDENDREGDELEQSVLSFAGSCAIELTPKYER